MATSSYGRGLHFVSGQVGVKEIERLIKKLQLDKEILADQEDEDAAS